MLSQLPPNFIDVEQVAGISNAVTMKTAPDGRLFLSEQQGTLLIVKDGRLLAEPFLRVPVDNMGERGLLGVAFDPAFDMNQHIYVYYTAAGPQVHNRVSRFTARGDTVVPGSEVVLVDLPPVRNWLHNGGSLVFGTDGKLYVAVGDDDTPDQAQRLDNPFGKILRIKPDGSIPDDNPFADQTTGLNRAIWALGLRNPFTIAKQPSTDRILINDVGRSDWEEINLGAAGANYGWPVTEGPTSDPRFTGPLHAYAHSTPTDFGCAITAGVFYDPAQNQFPDEYRGQYYFTDFCNGKLQMLDLSTGAVSVFGTDLPKFPVAMEVTPDGSLWLLSRVVGVVTAGDASGVLNKISYRTDLNPILLTQPKDALAAKGELVTFSVKASGAEPLSYQWQHNEVDIPGANRPSYMLRAASQLSNGGRFRVIVRNQLGAVVSEDAVLRVVPSHRPRVSVSVSPRKRFYNAGERVRFQVGGTDREDGSLPLKRISFRVDMYHDDHVHPYVPTTTGRRIQSLRLPTDLHSEGTIWFRVYVTAKDSSGLSTTVTRDIWPEALKTRTARNYTRLKVPVVAI